ncbi:MAG: class I tRNA ligase family protein [Candidatus Pacebacteria bacterium]|nr:class I tRNA ligase family protein [Candidatus Paceibacterota bacterium]
MAEFNPKPQTEVHAGDALKTKSALREEAVLAFWQEHDIFQKSLEKDSPKGNFVFYDGPPYATGLPHFGHMIPSTIKDVIPRYKTMQGYNVPRKWGWDCHGLPIENLIEKELGLTDKKAIEEYGIDKFNKAAKDSVFRYDIDWKRLVRRAGRWVDMENDYHTMDSSYTESVWWSFKTLQDKGFVYEAFKVMPFCPRCQTTLSNFEVGQGYKDIPDISAYVLFELLNKRDTEGTALTDSAVGTPKGESFLAWTTTPWTLPGNTALAVNPELKYSLLETTQKDISVKLWVATDLIPKLKEKNILPQEATVLKEVAGTELEGISYVPPFDFYANTGTLSANQETKRANAWKVQCADFVTAEDGTGIVHIAPAFGDDDYKLSVEMNLPVIIHVGPDGKIKEGNGSLSGLYAKPKGDHQLTDIEVIKLLSQLKNSTNSPLLFAKEKLVHSYPHCWRCDTPLLNYATSSWFVRVTDMKDTLIAENNKVNWIPKEVGEGRFGKWIENVRDWAISRSRYWGAPLPIWRGQKTGKVEFIGSVSDLKSKIESRGNNITLMRHGEAESNTLDVINSDPSEAGREKYGLTMHGRGQVEEAAQKLLARQKETGKKITKIYSSDFRRTRETAEHVANALGLDKTQIVFDTRLREVGGGDFEGGKWSGRAETGYFKTRHDTVYKKNPGTNGESVEDVKKRSAEFLYDLDSKHEDENILVVTHGLPLRLMVNTINGQTCRDLLRSGWRDYSDPNASLHEMDFKQLPHNESMELDLHRPYIDRVTWESEVEEGLLLLDGTKAKSGEKETMVRVPEVFDVWYDSGAMPFAQAHYPFENKDLFEENNSPIFPADFIAEGLDQTRGWFYSLMVLGVGLFGKSPYKNVIVNGLMLAEDGRKMSKSLKNYPPMEPTFDKYGVDPLRYFIASSSVTHSEEVLFSEKTLDEINKKIFNRLENVYSFYVLYAEHVPVSEGLTPDSVPHSDNVLDKWIVARLSSLKNDIEKGLDTYQIDKAARPIADIVDDLSTWYLRRSRDRFKGDDAKDKEQAMQTTRFALLTLSKLIAPFVPFMAEHMYQSIRNEIARVSSTSAVLMPESVHLADWPTLPVVDHALIDAMKVARKLVETGLAIRAKSGIKVRQPLASFVYTHEEASSETGIELSEDFLQIIKEELNVKEVKKGSELALDTNLTVELKEEGIVRDAIRGVQEARKNAGLIPSDFIVLTVSASSSTLDILKKNEEMLKKPIQAEKVEYVEVEVEEPLLEVTKI